MNYQQWRLCGVLYKEYFEIFKFFARKCITIVLKYIWLVRQALAYVYKSTIS